MARECIFCGGTPVTREDVFPKWITPILEQDPRELPDRRHYVTTRDTELAWDSTDLLGYKARCVCEPCNGGWMSRIEYAAGKIVGPMIRDEPTTLKPKDQRTVAAWLGLKAVVMRYASPSPSEVDRATLDYFYQHRRPPRTWTTWIAGYRGSWPYYYAGHNRTLRSDAVIAAFVIGHFAAKVFGTSGHEIAPVLPNLLRVQPATGRNLAWPPLAGIIADDSLKAFNAFVGVRKSSISTTKG